MNARERLWHAASRVGAGSGPLARPYWDVVLFAVYAPRSVGPLLSSGLPAALAAPRERGAALDPAVQITYVSYAFPTTAFDFYMMSCSFVPHVSRRVSCGFR